MMLVSEESLRGLIGHFWLTRDKCTREKNHGSQGIEAQETSRRKVWVKKPHLRWCFLTFVSMQRSCDEKSQLAVLPVVFGVQV